MSGTLNISFGADMPAAAVEVIAPDLTSVDRVWLRPSQRESVVVPSEASFLRVHLPSGQIVTLEDPGNLDRVINLSDIMSRTASGRPVPGSPRRSRSLGDLKRQASIQTYLYEPPAAALDLGTVTLNGGVEVRLLGVDQQPQTGTIREANTCVVYRFPTVATDPAIVSAFELALDLAELHFRVRLPGRLEEVVVRSDELDGGRRIVTVRVRTTNAAADTIGGYMNRGDLHSAATLASTAQKAEELLWEKVEDPFSAAVGAYLLLRLRRFDLMHDWTANLANLFPELADGAVIRAWHLIHVGAKTSEAEVRSCFTRALAAPLPVFTEGLQLLSDGLRLLGTDAQVLAQSLNKRAGVVQWSSPFTTTCHGTREGSSGRVDVDIDYGSQI